MDTAIIIGGGQGGLGTAFALRNQGFRPLVLEAGTEPVGSWPHYYDSLVAFTPVCFFSLPGLPFPGDPSHFPARDEVVAYLRRYASLLDCEIRTGTRVLSVVADPDGYVVTTEDGTRLHAPVVVAATGTFGHPHRPALGLGRYTGTVLHSCGYRSPEPFAGQRVVVVGSGTSAVQIARELSGTARTTIASRRPIRFGSTRFRADSARYWRFFGMVGRLPVGPALPRLSELRLVVDYSGAQRRAVEEGRPDRRPMFTGGEGRELRWSDGTREMVDAVVLATGYRPALEYLRPLGALRADGTPRQRHGLSTSHPGLAYIGVEGQHTLFSDALNGVGPDARHIARALRRRVARREPALRRRTASPALPG
ncbi:flavin-containing monooxygenase [Streptomyces yaizuensis]|uniref:NAD(P)-binding domain-containing protein n=1 Tax=Streptomyces yaizuensis TaxID=2989713 RepID=A0ABQ5NWD2_9ACTN|nr:NAD(P)/FAD-dependent oxidoreductase [Streptomyces sp. YSPA8]GLF94647.1 NAD(P)-binding domain-containing protein [Streptomyces sp. YSPA8]